MSAAIVAFGAWSPLGRGAEAASAGCAGECARVALRPDEAFANMGLRSPVAGRVANAPDGIGRPAALLRGALGDCTAALDIVRPGWRDGRVGLALGTSSGGMLAAERFIGALARGEPPEPEVARGAMYFAAVQEAVRAQLRRPVSPATVVLSACASSTIALGLALRWIERDACDVVLAGGFDAIARFVVAGFESLHATTATLPHPFAIDRDGLAVGEGACVLALVGAPAPGAIGELRGFGAAGDAVHLTAPDREGRGLARAAARALASSGLDASLVDLVSAHATSTPYNDAAEARGLRAVLGARAADVPVHPFKAQIGHTMGAAGALETLAAVDALARQLAPAAVQGAADPDVRVTLLARAEPRPLRAALKLSAAFGGATAALVLAPACAKAHSFVRGGPGASCMHVPRPRGPAYVLDVAAVRTMPSVQQLGLRIPSRAARLGRACEMSHLALMALSELATRQDLAGAGIVVGHAYATIDVNYMFYARVLERGPAAAEPQRFPYTTPQAVGGECSIAFGLTGPNVSVGSGLHGGLEALAVGAELVEAGDADRIVVVAADVPGRAVRALAEAAGWPVPELGAVAVLLGREPGSGGGARRVLSYEVELGGPAGEPLRIGHLALLPLAAQGGSRPAVLESVSPQGRAKVTLTS